MSALVIVPGWQDSGPQHWQTLWEKTYPGCWRVQQQDWQRPVCTDWVAGLAACVSQVEERPMLVAHSLGCSTVVHWAASLSLAQQRRVKGVLLVAPPDVRGAAFAQGVPASGFDQEPDWRLPFPSILVASSNDPYCSLTRAAQLAEQWGSHFIDLGPVGHINSDSQLGDWQMGQRLLQRLLLAD